MSYLHVERAWVCLLSVRFTSFPNRVVRLLGSKSAKIERLTSNTKRCEIQSESIRFGHKVAVKGVSSSGIFCLDLGGSWGFLCNNLTLCSYLSWVDWT
jgi:hypothetical protein